MNRAERRQLLRDKHAHFAKTDSHGDWRGIGADYELCPHVHVDPKAAERCGREHVRTRRWTAVVE